MKKFLFIAAIMACMCCASCNNDKNANNVNNNGDNKPLIEKETPISTEKPQIPGHEQGDKAPSPEERAERAAKAKENAKVYNTALEYLKDKHPDFEGWDVSVVLDSIQRFQDPTYSKSTKHMGVSWKQMRDMRETARTNKPEKNH